MFKRTTILAAFAAFALAPAAGATALGPSSGSFSTTPIDVADSVTINLGPAGIKRIAGVKQLRVGIAWANVVGIVRPVLGGRCPVDLAARIAANRRTTVRVTYSYVRRHPSTHRDTRYRFTRRFDSGALGARAWDFGVCAG